MSEAEVAPAWIEAADGIICPISGSCRLGRAADNEVVVQGDNISRYHAVIQPKGGEFCLVDLGSKNGTLLNDRRIVWPMRLNDGDRISIAASSFVFHQLVSPPDDREVETTLGGVTRLEISHEPCWLLIADLENSAQLAKKLSPHELASTIGHFIKTCRAVVENRGGTLDKYLGDGFLAYWRAGRTKPAHVVAALGDLREAHTASPVPFRVVLHFGTTSFGRAANPGESIMTGDEVNFVFRLEKLASASKISFCVSDAAQTHLAGLAQLEPIGAEQELKGYSGTHLVYRLV